MRISDKYSGFHAKMRHFVRLWAVVSGHRRTFAAAKGTKAKVPARSNRGLSENAL